jgi:hypothetical protein
LTEKDMKEKRVVVLFGLAGGLIMLYQWAYLSNLSLRLTPGIVVFLGSVAFILFTGLQLGYYQVKIMLLKRRKGRQGQS